MGGVNISLSLLGAASLFIWSKYWWHVNGYSLSTLTVDSEVIWKLAGITYSMLKHLPFSSAEAKRGKRIQRINQDILQQALVPVEGLCVHNQKEASLTVTRGPSKETFCKKPCDLTVTQNTPVTPATTGWKLRNGGLSSVNSNVIGSGGHKTEKADCGQSFSQ